MDFADSFMFADHKVAELLVSTEVEATVVTFEVGRKAKLDIRVEAYGC